MLVRRGFIGAMAALGLTACGATARAPTPSAAHPLLGGPAPVFARPAVDGARVDMAALRGRRVVVKFFAKSCAPCQRTLPATQRFHQEHPEVAVIGIAEDEHLDDALGQIQAHGLTFPVVHDRGQVLSGRFRVAEMPASFVVDAAGVITWVGGEHTTHEDLAAAALAP